MALATALSRISAIQQRIGAGPTPAGGASFAGLVSDAARHAGVQPAAAPGAAGGGGLLSGGPGADVLSAVIGQDQAALGLLAPPTTSLGTAPVGTAPVGTAPVGTAPVGTAAAGLAGPLASPLPGFAPGSPYGWRTDPINGSHRHHDGQDIGAPTGTPIRSMGPGQVTFAGVRGGYGNLVIVDHGGGVETRYAHQSALAVGVGDRVDAGTVVGAVGSTGRSTGPHLHFEVRVGGEAVDPTPYLARAT